MKITSYIKKSIKEALPNLNVKFRDKQEYLSIIGSTGFMSVGFKINYSLIYQMKNKKDLLDLISRYKQKLSFDFERGYEELILKRFTPFNDHQGNRILASTVLESKDNKKVIFAHLNTINEMRLNNEIYYSNSLSESD